MNPLRRIELLSKLETFGQ
jgi:hypothetical protein